MTLGSDLKWPLVTYSTTDNTLSSIYNILSSIRLQAIPYTNERGRRF